MGVWIDHLIDLQHNGGYIFDKDESRVPFGPEKSALLDGLLDFKFDRNNSYKNFLQFGLNAKLITQEEYNQMLVQQIDSIKKARDLLHSLRSKKSPIRPTHVD